ncbi:Minichromosome maintenance protein MCM [Candidatus Bilamarchaeum dharawalense]|uniref:DNA helicase n=1 Tax=Candidatus Bilamarchaeum dharawalense TaxID=2885759 RepID=A0A5E4LQ37_9ARCH|nr:Minichromosome maintenance protein MCM [Candidatus Bilamarchaeum dharawalense]
MQVDLSSQIAVFNDFFTNIYRQKIDDLLAVYPTQKSIYISFADLEKFDPDMADALVKSPDLIIEAAEEAIKQLNLSVAAGTTFTPHVRFNEMPSENAWIEEISSKNIKELVAFKCVVTKRAEVMHRVKVAMYRCSLCDAEMKLFVGKNFTPPKRCDSCKKFALQQVEEESTFTDIQRAEVQELLERVRGGAPAAHIELLLEDDLVNKIAPGDNIEIVGILRLKPPIKARQKQELVYSRYIEVNSAKSLKRDFEEIEITKEDERRLKELAKNPNINEIIAKSIAPSIYGHTEVKKALALQLFGGTRGKTMKGGMPIRDDIHVLLIGDPGIAKSRFLQSVSEIAPKSIYVSGKSVSGAGLTVSAEKDELGEGGWTLKAGALVLASGGTAQIDEFDKIEDEDRAALHEAMETQTISVAKAGIVAKFRTKTSILAAANPKHGRFDQTKNLSDQFDVPPTLLSRFDLIFPIVDVLDEEKDTKLAEHILATHMGNIGDEPDAFEKDILRKYIAYARRKIFPKLTTAAAQKIKEFYVDLRRKGKDTGSVAITPRYLEGLVRLAEANAKMRLNDTVEEEDAETAISLFNYVMMQIMTDRGTGSFDIDVVATGKPKSEREKLQKADTIMDIIREHLRKHETADVEQVISDAKSYDIDEPTARRILAELLRKGVVYEKEYGHIKIVGE